MESKLKRAVLLIAMDSILKNAQYSPDRCARNLIDLGVKAYPSLFTPEEQKKLQSKFAKLCRNCEAKEIKEAFLTCFSRPFL